ncbi:hypothetical protein DSLASN_33840 [Desulfoluna limicola]|uniref:Uncharacterized protein n=1 Tax=Desulfoluna limicola TaxID=2810562 RepID=A0ABM7PJL9_9BACT|nr:hypothetical protein DSLASN_33840 [Desulfoluna limicola]
MSQVGLSAASLNPKMLPVALSGAMRIRNPPSMCFSLQWYHPPRRRSYSGKG